MKLVFALILTVVIGFGMLAGTAGASGTPQIIYLNPRTGDVIAGPGIGTDGANKPAGKTTRSGQTVPEDAANGGRSSSAGSTGHLPVVQCPDGSLRMGSIHPDDPSGTGYAAALCDKPLG